MKMLLTLCIALGAFAARAADEKPAEKPNRLERSVTKAGKAMERTGDRAAKATVNGLDRAGKATGRQVERAGNAVGRTADKTTDWVKKKTE
jgi:hypothetical protein